MDLNNKKNIFISTPIYYINADLHLGHCYTTVLADIYNRYQKLIGNDTFFVTGCDVHGEKVYKAAQTFLNKDFITDDEMLKELSIRENNIKDLWKILKIEFDCFISTSQKSHIKNVQNIFSKFFNDKNIYLGTYKGYYSETDECYYSFKEVKDKNIDLNKLKILKEKSYFLNLSKLKKTIQSYLNNDVLIPKYRRKEILNYFFKKNTLKDLSITRQNNKWGIINPIDNSSTIYVWFDALINYLSALKFEQKNINNLFNKYWSNNSLKIQFMGKEIIRFHAIYWPAILLCLDLPLPDKLVTHGWLIYDKKKMSKSEKNVVNPFLFLKKHNFEYLRYYFIWNSDLKSDYSFSERQFINTINTTLINNFGNFINRVFHMIKKNFDSKISFTKINNKKNYQEIINSFFVHLNNFEFNKAVLLLIKFINNQNKHLNETEPWKNINITNKKTYLSYFQNYFIIINIVFFLFSPIFVDSYLRFIDTFSVILNTNTIQYTDEINFDNIVNLKYFENKTFKINRKIELIFQKIDK